MTTPVKGPQDVAIGDTVLVGGSGRFGCATVVKVTAGKVSVRWPDGATSAKAYSRTERTFVGRAYQDYNFARLDARERWTQSQPTSDAVAGYSEPSHSFSTVAIRDRPEDVKKQIDALSAWLKDEPSKGST